MRLVTPEEIGKRLRTLRGIRTRRGVARETGIGESALGNYESGSRVPNDRAKEILARYYKTTVGELFYNEDTTQSSNVEPELIS